MLLFFYKQSKIAKNDLVGYPNKQRSICAEVTVKYHGFVSGYHCSNYKMQNEKEENLHNKSDNRPNNRGEMKKRRVIMEDGQRYLIFYTFEKPVSPISGEKQYLEAGAEERENV